IIEALRPVFATLPPSAMRMELTGMVSSRLALPESLAEQLLSEAGGRQRAEARPRAERSEEDAPAGRAPVRNGGLARSAGRRDDPERAFLALCIASPEEGSAALGAMDVDADFSSDVLARAARRLRGGDLSAPMADRP